MQENLLLIEKDVSFFLCRPWLIIETSLYSLPIWPLEEMNQKKNQLNATQQPCSIDMQRFKRDK